MQKDLKYIAYCRRSQDREDKQTLTIEMQQKALREFAKSHTLHITEMVSESMSAYKRGRPKFKHMMDEIEKGKANAILVWHLSRLARNGADGGLMISFMDEGKIVEMRTPEKTFRNTSDDKFSMAINFAMTKKSSDDTSSFVKNNTKAKIEKGEYPGLAHYGYLNIGKNGVIAGKRFSGEKQALLEALGRPLARIERDPMEAPIIRKLVELALTGAYNMHQLQQEAFKMGIQGKYSGKALSVQMIINILTDVFLTGKFEWNGEILPGKHEPIITQSEYDRVQKILFQKSRPKTTKHDYTFSTLVHCPLCNHRMSGEFQKNTHYYRCTKAKGRNPTCTNKKHIRQDELDREIEQVLLRLKVPDGIVQWALKYLHEQYIQESKNIGCKQALLESNIREEKATLNRLTKKWLSPENADGTLISDEDYKEAKLKATKNISEWELQLTDKRGEEENWVTLCEQFFTKIRNLPREYTQVDTVGKRILLKGIGARFVRKEEAWLVELDEPFSLILEAQNQEILSEPDFSLINKPKNAAQPSETVTWLGR